MIIFVYEIGDSEVTILFTIDDADTISSNNRSFKLSLY